MGTSYLIKEETLQSIADSIRQKMEESVQIAVSDFADKILKIETGTDTSDATATANNLEAGVTAYAKGKKIEGELPNLCHYWGSNGGEGFLASSGELDISTAEWTYTANFGSAIKGFLRPRETVQLTIPVRFNVSGGKLVGKSDNIFVTTDLDDSQRLTVGTIDKPDVSGRFFCLYPRGQVFNPDKEYAIIGTASQTISTSSSSSQTVTGNFKLINFLGKYIGTMPNFVTVDGKLIISGERAFTLSGIDNGQRYLLVSGETLPYTDDGTNIEIISAVTGA